MFQRESFWRLPLLAPACPYKVLSRRLPFQFHFHFSRTFPAFGSGHKSHGAPLSSWKQLVLYTFYCTRYFRSPHIIDEKNPSSIRTGIEPTLTLLSARVIEPITAHAILQYSVVLLNFNGSPVLPCGVVVASSQQQQGGMRVEGKSRHDTPRFQTAAANCRRGQLPQPDIYNINTTHLTGTRPVHHGTST